MVPQKEHYEWVPHDAPERTLWIGPSWFPIKNIMDGSLMVPQREHYGWVPHGAPDRTLWMGPSWFPIKNIMDGSLMMVASAA